MEREVGGRGIRERKVGDLNLTRDPGLDNEKRRPAPAPGVARALDHLNDVMGGAVDVYRTLHPKGRSYTHGTVEELGSRRRLDAWLAQASSLAGPGGIVSERRVDREAAGFSYVNAHTRRERYKESDHDCVQVTLRATTIPRPKARAA